ncbi:MAG TPA: PepSY-associated TM helix domain-containing protein [Aliidiomarina sp.]|nr:PepSY-associated TM helix domain-containing protein [Aliidiomarina sp.]
MTVSSSVSKPAVRQVKRRAPQKRQPRKRGLFGSIKSWHWISSAACLIATLGFAITGITLNHANSVESVPTKSVYELAIPDSVKQVLTERQQNLLQGEAQAEGPLPSAFKEWYRQQAFGSGLKGISAEWDDYEVYVGLPRAGGDRWFRVDLSEGVFYQENIDRGWVAFFNDLHKGRNTSGAWITMLDLLAVVMLVYAITGLLLLKRYAKGRKSTWPLVIAGLLLPWLFLIIPAHASEAQEAKLTVTIPELTVAEYHRPYVAVWLANERHQRVHDLALWYDGKMADKEGEKWLKDIRQWWRRSGRTLSFPIDGVSGATRRPGTYTIEFKQLIEQFQNLPAGDYYLNVEAAREVGGREHLTLAITLPLPQINANAPFSVVAEGEHELGRVEFNVTTHQ